ncbi:hypothetical protein EZY14_009255 [Kordia sp. TARA_039_SRF]|nr:hypothetical protein EZY14_009255 [Kordia sp. TARA_039_SRF]
MENEIPDFLTMARKLKTDLVRYTSIYARNFFKESFQNQGFTDTNFSPWQPRKNDVDPGRKILVKSSVLLNSIQVFKATTSEIRIGSDQEYADIHNNGGVVTIPITDKSRRYFWYMFKSTGNGMWKALALTNKKSITVKIPKRQFIGESKVMMDKIQQWVIKEIEKRFNNL